MQSIKSNISSCVKQLRWKYLLYYLIKRPSNVYTGMHQMNYSALLLAAIVFIFTIMMC